MNLHRLKVSSCSWSAASSRILMTKAGKLGMHLALLKWKGAVQRAWACKDVRGHLMQAVHVTMYRGKAAWTDCED